MNRQLVYLTACLTLGGFAQVVSAALLAVDVNDRTAADTPNSVAGFESFVLSGTTATVSTPTTQTIGAYTVKIAPFDDMMDENTVTEGVQDTAGVLDDRDRTTPTDGGSFTFAQIYDDFVFAQTGNGPTGGMDLTISGGTLVPNTPYRVAIYAFDTGSTAAPQPRSATWLDGNNASALIVNTSFSGADLPTTDDQYRFAGTALTDASGVLRLLGRNTTPNGTNGATSIGVFLNGFEIDVIPEPGSLVLVAAAAATLLLRRRPARW